MHDGKQSRQRLLSRRLPPTDTTQVACVARTCARQASATASPLAGQAGARRGAGGSEQRAWCVVPCPQAVLQQCKLEAMQRAQTSGGFAAATSRLGYPGRSNRGPPTLEHAEGLSDCVSCQR